MDDEILAGHYAAIPSAKRGPTEKELTDAPELNRWSAGIEWDYVVYLHGSPVGHPRLGVSTLQHRSLSPFIQPGNGRGLIPVFIVSENRRMFRSICILISISSMVTVRFLLERSAIFSQDHAEIIIWLSMERGFV
ncbi:hypothetical protein D2T31_20275 [Sinirhodobacter populi]|uniref:Uncharacterized protein n=1 Tax=Paenirhodobacter populi TaxID=2306993 RepID=A0A443K0N2_9RHOB|nr:hypothetical protein [Sinirhodobacter populi]RWR26363.1 hypothetical protein D2T31_20275 [Sinirhodobacter populi]